MTPCRAWAPTYRSEAWARALGSQSVYDPDLTDELGERFGGERRARHEVSPRTSVASPWAWNVTHSTPPPRSASRRHSAGRGASLVRTQLRVMSLGPLPSATAHPTRVAAVPRASASGRGDTRCGCSSETTTWGSSATATSTCVQMAPLRAAPRGWYRRSSRA
jgi:hypothetical protein